MIVKYVIYRNKYKNIVTTSAIFVVLHNSNNFQHSVLNMLHQIGEDIQNAIEANLPVSLEL